MNSIYFYFINKKPPVVSLTDIACRYNSTVKKNELSTDTGVSRNFSRLKEANKINRKNAIGNRIIKGNYFLSRID